MKATTVKITRVVLALLIVAGFLYLLVYRGQRISAKLHSWVIAAMVVCFTWSETWAKSYISNLTAFVRRSDHGVYETERLLPHLRNERRHIKSVYLGLTLFKIVAGLAAVVLANVSNDTVICFAIVFGYTSLLLTAPLAFDCWRRSDALENFIDNESLQGTRQRERDRLLAKFSDPGPDLSHDAQLNSYLHSADRPKEHDPAGK